MYPVAAPPENEKFKRDKDLRFGGVKVRLNLNLTCDDGTAKVPMQLFWLKDGERHYKEEQSVRFEILSGAQLINLRSAPGWPMNETVNRIRLDIDSKGVCVDLRLVNPALGLVTGG